MNWKNTVMNGKELNEAFDGDFGEVSFDHKPTAEDIFLVKLNLVAQAQAEVTWDKAIREVVEWMKSQWPHLFHSPYMSEEVLQAQLKEVWGVFNA